MSTALRWKDDPKGYMRRKNAERRAKARAAGICLSCNAEKARPGMTKCADCAAISKLLTSLE